MIDKLDAKYSPELLKDLPQYKRLIRLYNSLAHLQPKESISDVHPHIIDIGLEDLQHNDPFEKRAPMSVSFMGMQVSYPQYLRLITLQAKVVKLDKLMRKMLTMKTLDELQKIPKWNTLVSLHAALEKMLPQNYVTSHETFSDAKTDEENKNENGEAFDYLTEKNQLSKRSIGTIEFNGKQVSYPQYWKLMELQKKVMKLDILMQRIADHIKDPEDHPKWKALTSLRQSLENYLPSKRLSKRSPTMDFNGAQVIKLIHKYLLDDFSMYIIYIRREIRKKYLECI